MAQFNPYEQYNSVNFTTADPGTLIITTYEAVIRALKEAQRGIREKDFDSRVKSFDLAFDLVCELRSSLNPEKGGEVADRLNSLYEFFTREIIMANATSDPDRLNPVIKIFDELRDAWEQARKKQPV
ncbi:MAG TPA: flagellar export chaperone FliS [Bacteroidetes bacterium]|nr:flagellar export chaperone FliS [Bacteroidota bacterium]